MHLILDCNPVYTTWQPFKLALLADSLLLSYIYVRHTNFLPPSLTIGKARNLGPRYTTAEDLAPLRDKSAKRVSQSHKVHVPIEEPEDPAWIAELEAAKTDQGEEMVTRRAMTVDRSLPGTGPLAQPQHP